LLKARAIENQCFVLGVNRCGEDGNGLQYRGDTQIIDPAGGILANAGAAVQVVSLDLQAEQLQQTRQALPFLRDKDDFMLL
jgi:predicted amidohydrolase